MKPDDMAALDGQSGFMQQEDTGNQVYALHLVTMSKL